MFLLNQKDEIIVFSSP